MSVGGGREQTQDGERDQQAEHDLASHRRCPPLRSVAYHFFMNLPMGQIAKALAMNWPIQ
jgi:hypothetical protein